MEKLPRLVLTVLALALPCAQQALAQSQPYPARPIRLIIAFPAGASMDISARTIAPRLAEGVGQQVIVDNRPGGNTIVAADAAAHAPADGHTLFMALDSTLTLLPAVYAKIPYDPLRDFAPVTLFSRGSYSIVSHPRMPFRSMTEVVAWARANPGKLNVGASTVLTQILATNLKTVAGADIAYVPYKGTPPMFQGLMGGEIDMVIDAVPLYLPQIRQGKLTALATTGSARSVQLPDIPTTREAGFPTLEADTWTGFFAPGGTPDPIVRRLNSELHKVFASPDFRQRMQDAGQNPIFPSTPEQLGAMVKQELTKWAPMVKAAGIKLE